MADRTHVEIEWDDDEIKAAIAEASMEGLELAAEHLLAVSSARAPHEEGTLERSGDIDKDESARAVSVFFDTPYAVRQHEELTWRHDEGKTAKYLEGPMFEEKDTLLELLAGPIRERLAE